MLFEDLRGKSLMEAQEQGDIFSSMINSINIERMISGFYRHLESKVRLGGCKSHMSMMEDFFGEEYARDKLKQWAKKSIFVANAINEFINQNENEKTN